MRGLAWILPGKVRFAGAALAALVLAGPGASRTQDARNTFQAHQDPAPAHFATTPGTEEHLFGTWGGVRTNLGDLGIALLANYTTETVGVVSGGRRQGADYAHQVTLEADVDWGKLAGLNGFSTHGVLVNLAGNNASAGLLGDRCCRCRKSTAVAATCWCGSWSCSGSRSCGTGAWT